MESCRITLAAALLLAACATPTATPTPSPTATATPVPEEGWVTGIIIVEDIDLLIMSQNPPQVRVVARGYLPDGCQRIRGVSQERTRNVYRVTISVVRPKADVACTLVAVPFVERVDLDLTGLPLGAYTVIVHGLHGSFEIRAGDDPQ